MKYKSVSRVKDEVYDGPVKFELFVRTRLTLNCSQWHGQH